METRQLGYFVVVAVLLVGVAAFSSPELLARLQANERLQRWGTRVLERLRPAERVDPVADELYRVLRRERLRGDIRRLQRILATDSSMSATRQLGNRLAYDWLLAELDELAGSPEPVTVELSDAWDDPRVRAQTTEVYASHVVHPGSTVETLDVRLWP